MKLTPVQNTHVKNQDCMQSSKKQYKANLNLKNDKKKTKETKAWNHDLKKLIYPNYILPLKKIKRN